MTDETGAPTTQLDSLDHPGDDLTVEPGGDGDWAPVWERALAVLEDTVTPHTRLGGHLMQGHVDGVGRILARSPGDAWELVRIALPPELARYVVEKGSIAVDGVSLTVSAVSPADLPEPWFEVSLIPTTLRETTLGVRTPGEPVNLEVDVIAKYVERLLAARTGDGAR